MPADDYFGRKPRERTKVELDAAAEVVRYWTTELGCTEAELRAAVEAVGTNAEDVRRHLWKSRNAPATRTDNAEPALPDRVWRA